MSDASLVESKPSSAERSPLISGSSDPGRVSPHGDRLAFIISPMRSGSTLLRRMLNAHPTLVSPPETWFLLPLFNLWAGQGEIPSFNMQQATVALRTVASQEAFIKACRAFAAEIYSNLCTLDTRYVIDKTPMYLRVADDLPGVFPQAKFIVLVRDPRAVVWSLHTWDKVPTRPPEHYVAPVAQRLAQQHAFASRNEGRSIVVTYEALCAAPDASSVKICEFLDVQFDSRMIEYALQADVQPGYGDDRVNQHRRPHTDSMERWRGDDTGGGLSAELQAELATKCTAPILSAFGYDELAVMCD